MQTFRWLRVVGDTLFTFGVAALVLFVLGLKTGSSIARPQGHRVAGST